MTKSIFIGFVATFLSLISCKTKDTTSRLNYMQNVENIATETSLKTSVNTIQKGDALLIFVSAKNMDVVKPFNQNYYNSQSSPTVTSPNSEKSFIVDSEGNINFPVIGAINTTDKSTEDLREYLTKEISRYVKEPTVTVRLINFKVTLLGEVARPGQVGLQEGQSNLLSAIGLAGDLTMYAKRDDILLVRNVNGQIEKARINLMDANFFNSPYFQLKQNDVIYVSSNDNKEKISRQDPNTNVYIAVAGMVIGLAGIFITIFKN